MANSAYLKIPNITGSCTAVGHEKEIEIVGLKQNFSFDKEKISSAKNIKNSVEEMLNPLKDSFIFTQQEIKTLADKLTDEFKEYRNLVRGTNNALTNTESTINKIKSLEVLLEKERRSIYNKFRGNEEVKNYFNSAKEKKDNDFLDMDLIFSGKTEQIANIADFETYQSNKITELLKKIKSSVSTRSSLEFDKSVDASSPLLFEACCTGKVFDKECILTIYRSIIPSSSGRIKLSNKETNNYVAIKMYNAYIVSYYIQHNSKEEIPKETINMNYDKVEFKFVQGDPKTGKKGQQKIISWDWTTNKAEEKGG
jgi:type VI secretion system Hcp family effector